MLPAKVRELRYVETDSDNQAFARMESLFPALLDEWPIARCAAINKGDCFFVVLTIINFIFRHV